MKCLLLSFMCVLPSSDALQLEAGSSSQKEKQRGGQTSGLCLKIILERNSEVS